MEPGRRWRGRDGQAARTQHSNINKPDEAHSMVLWGAGLLSLTARERPSMGRPDDARAGAARRCAGKLHGRRSAAQAETARGK